MPEVTPGELIHRIWYAKHYMDGLYKQGAGGAFVSEYPAFPVGIVRSGDLLSPRLAGFYRTGRGVLAILESPVITYDLEEYQCSFEDSGDWDYEEPRLTLRRQYLSSGLTHHTIVFQHYEGTNVVDLYLGDEFLASIDQNTTPFIQWLRTTGPWRGYPSHRYTMRHAAQLGEKIFLACSEPSKADALRNVLDQFGFTYDIYDPMFHWSTGEGDDYFFSWQAYHDCDFCRDYNEYDPPGCNPLPRGLNPHRYPYESKVCSVGLGRGACWIGGSYIWVSQRDRLCRALQAIHMLNKYSDPDHQYGDPGGGGFATPRLIARDLEDNCWNGHGINAYWAGEIGGPPWDLASGVRTNAFAVLETLLGYKYYDATSRDWAKKVIDVLVNVQWGVQRPCNVDGKGITENEGLLLRPPNTGGCFGGWKGSYQYSYHGGILDEFNMPSEVLGVFSTNMEATATYFQALRTYLHYAYGIDCPTSSLIP